MATVDDFIAALESQLGAPYVFGGSNPSVGFDCSGLVQWAAEVCGVAVARTTQGEWDTLPAGDGSRGDLVEFDVPSDGPPQPQHVGVCLGNGTMINAPHTGTVVQIDPIPNIPGSISIMGYRRIAFAPVPPPPPPVPTFLEVLGMPSPVSDPGFAVRFLYRFALHREVDPAGYTANVNWLAAGGSLNTVLQNLQDSTEGQEVLSGKLRPGI